MKEQWILEQIRKYDNMKDWFPSYTVSQHGLTGLLSLVTGSYAAPHTAKQAW